MSYPTITLEVGKRYVARNGHVSNPLTEGDSSTYPFLATFGAKGSPFYRWDTYRADGSYCVVRGEEGPWDLVSEVPDPAEKLRAVIEAGLAAFQKVDADTKWSESEPKWWLEWHAWAADARAALKESTPNPS